MRKKLSENYNLAICFPEIAKEWHPTKNGNLTPLNFHANSRWKAWWICKRGHEWQAAIDSRNGSKNRKGTGCLRCYRMKKRKRNIDGTFI